MITVTISDKEWKMHHSRGHQEKNSSLTTDSQKYCLYSIYAISFRNKVFIGILFVLPFFLFFLLSDQGHGGGKTY